MCWARSCCLALPTAMSSAHCFTLKLYIIGNIRQPNFLGFSCWKFSHSNSAGFVGEATENRLIFLSLL